MTSPGVELVRSRATGPRGVLVELGLVTVALGCNLLVRWYTLDDLAKAVANARHVLDLERALGLDLEHAVQDAALAVPGLSAFCDWYYVWGYFAVLAAALVGLYVRRPAAYPVLRNALLASGVIGLFSYAFFPCAPPRLTDLGYTDTVASGVLDGAARPLGVANELAAIPSFHIGWLVIVSVVVYRTTASRVLRLAGVLHPMAMSYVVVATGNHWVLDIPAGLAIAALGLAVAGLLARVPGAAPTHPA